MHVDNILARSATWEYKRTCMCSCSSILAWWYVWKGGSREHGGCGCASGLDKAVAAWLSQVKAIVLQRTRCRQSGWSWEGCSQGASQYSAGLSLHLASIPPSSKPAEYWPAWLRYKLIIMNPQAPENHPQEKCPIYLGCWVFGGAWGRGRSGSCWKLPHCCPQTHLPAPSRTRRLTRPPTYPRRWMTHLLKTWRPGLPGGAWGWPHPGTGTSAQPGTVLSF